MTSHHRTSAQSVAGWLEGPPETSPTYKVKLEEASGAGNGLATQLDGPSQQAQGLMPRRQDDDRGLGVGDSSGATGGTGRHGKESRGSGPAVGGEAQVDMIGAEHMVDRACVRTARI